MRQNNYAYDGVPSVESAEQLTIFEAKIDKTEEGQNPQILIKLTALSGLF